MNDPLTHAPSLIRCPVCYFMLHGEWVEGGENQRACARCQQHLRVTTFPGLHIAPPMPTQPGVRALEGDATCFFHPEKRAERPCDRCGRFLCALCDLPLGARHLCPACLKLGPEENSALPELVTSRVSWGRLSLLLSLMIFVPGVNFFFYLTAPGAVFAALWGWSKPGSLVNGKRHLSATIGLLFGLAQVGLIVFWFYFVFEEATTHVR